MYGAAMSQQPPEGFVRARRRGTVTALVVVVLLALPTTAMATVGDPPTTSPASARIVLNGLAAVVGPMQDSTLPTSEQPARLPSSLSARVVIENRTDEALDGLRLVVTVHERATTRSQLRQALDATAGTGLDDEVVPFDQSLEAIPAGGFAQVEIDVPSEEAGLIDPDDDVVIHPISISVVRGRSVLDEVRTAAVGVARPIARPLQAVALAPLDGPVRDDDGARADLLPGGRLDRILRALEAAPAGAVTLAPAPHAAEDLGVLVDAAVPGATDMLARLSTVVTERGAGIVSSPYALADVPALAASTSTEDLATRSIVAGRQRLPALLGVAPDAAHLLVSPQTITSVDLAPADVLLSTWDDMSGPDLDANPSADIPPALRRARSAAGRSLDVLVGDPWVTEHLTGATGEHGWAVEAHRVVAETAMVFAKAPGVEGRAVAIMPPVGWEAPGRLPDELYSRLVAAPWLALDDPVNVAARTNVTAAWQATDTVAPDRTVLLGRLATAQDRLSGLASAVADMEEPPAVVARGDDLLRALSVWPSTEPLERATTILANLEDEVDAAIGTVVVPDDSVVTLASERGVIPVTIQHPDGVPLDVVVEVTSQGTLTFTEGTSRSLRLEEGGTATVSFEATALGRGDFPMAVTVRTPSREVVLAGQVVQVRASAVSRPALIAIGTVVLLLLLLGRRRRPKQPQLEVVR